MWQAKHIAGLLVGAGHEAEIEIIRTTGDRMQDPAFIAPETWPDGTPLDAKGIFIKEIEEALLEGRIDVAVHSLKDLPTTLDERFALVAVPARADARDALVCEQHWGLHMLPEGASVATTSPRRQAMLLALRPDLRFVEMRGNIDSRLRKWAAGEADALVLACAGLDRLGRAEHVHQRFSVDELTPAPGQGALGLEMCAKHQDEAVRVAVGALNDPAAAFATTAERAVLSAMGGGCLLPLGAYCHGVDGGWHLHAQVVASDGEEAAQVLVRVQAGETAQGLGERAAKELQRRGAESLLRGDSVLVE